ncbi:MAG: YebC/PmpR family DNA-binding transcriptional regulator [Syntrophomonadaceae bacterium]|jgi:YebC/PmpR family DNA-binding regulatory protein|nr:YebC/PmpR family DNA-binding transcriptional regulator [Syntrophomonadaceae bacterium]
MAGHSKWANIKHKKARTDEKRGKIFTKLGKEIIIAAREGGGDPDGNPRLKMLIQKAKAMNMPNDNINRAIQRGTGEIEGEALEEINYEGYGPGGVALMLNITTDNRNRTAAEIRHLFSKYGGNLGEAGCVGWMFKRRGLLEVNKEDLQSDVDEVELIAIEAGAEDIRDSGSSLEIVTTPDSFESVKSTLEEECGVQWAFADITMIPDTTVEVLDLDTVRKIIKLVDVLEDHDDVQDVYANFSIPDEIMEQV